MWSVGAEPSPLPSLRAEVEALRSEVQQLREEVAHWKAESHRQYCDAQYWRAMHQRALDRVARVEQENGELKAEVRRLRQQLFGRKTEQGQAGEALLGFEKPSCGRRRGQQRGRPGHGRREPSHLPEKVSVVDLPADQRQCPHCHLPFAEFPGTEDSQTIEIEVRAHRRVIKRKRYRRVCRCPGVPGIITAPAPPRLLPKTTLGISVWVTVLLDKYQFYRPTHRLIDDLATYGVALPQGTLTGGLKRLTPLFEPIYEQFVAESRRQVLWSADETRWLVFVQWEGKVGYRWYLWMYQSATVVVFQLDPSRSHDVPEGHFRGVAGGILLVDRYSAYKAMALVKEGVLILAFCWAHVRRDFITVGKSWPKLAAWAVEWLLRIRELYRLNRQRLQVQEDPVAFGERDRQLREALTATAACRDEQLSQKDLHPACRKTLQSLTEHWHGLTVFVDHPEVPMDNNHSERTERGPVVGRKNYYGSGSLWSGKLAAMLFSIFATLKLHGINPRQWLTAYLEACATTGSKTPSDLTEFLPWSMSAERKQSLSAPFASAPAAPDTS